MQPAWSEQRAWSPGAEHRRVLEHAEDLLRRSEEFLEQQGVEAGAAASGAPPSGSAALDRDARLLGHIDAFMGKAEAEARDEPMADASKEERSTRRNWFPTIQNPSTTGRTGLRAGCPGSSKRPRTWRFPRVSWRP